MITSFSAREFALHICNMTSMKKADVGFVEEILERYADNQVGLAMSGRLLTEAQRDEWLRANEWSGV